MYMKYDTKKTESHAVKFLAKIFWSGQKWLAKVNYLHCCPKLILVFFRFDPE